MPKKKRLTLYPGFLSRHPLAGTYERCKKHWQNLKQKKSWQKLDKQELTQAYLATFMA